MKKISIYGIVLVTQSDLHIIRGHSTEGIWKEVHTQM